MSATTPVLPGIKDLFPDHLFNSQANQYGGAPLSVPPHSSRSYSSTASDSYNHSTQRDERYAEDLSLSNSRKDYHGDRYDLSLDAPQNGAPTRLQKTATTNIFSVHPYTGPVPQNSSRTLRDLSRSQPHDLSRPSLSDPKAYCMPPNPGDGTRDKLLANVPGESRKDLDLSNRDGKRHTCPHCGKRFNRPSSLKIHVNTHTGAKPFSCPFPGCGRHFNVSSNMRRHFRNHTTSNPEGIYPGSIGNSPGLTLSHSLPSPTFSRQSSYAYSNSPPTLSSSHSFSSEEDEEDDDDDHRSIDSSTSRSISAAQSNRYSNVRSSSWNSSYPAPVAGEGFSPAIYTYPPPPPPPHHPSSGGGAQLSPNVGATLRSGARW